MDVKGSLLSASTAKERFAPRQACAPLGATCDQHVPPKGAVVVVSSPLVAPRSQTHYTINYSPNPIINAPLKQNLYNLIDP